MATYAAFKHVELYNVGKTKKRVLRPPGGGSSDIFGSDVPSTPRSVKNHMQSNIFSCEKGSVKNNGDQPRRGQKNVDSYTRLFGDPERPFTPAKNHMKSSIPFGGTAAAAAAAAAENGNGAANGNGLHASNGRNGKSENGGSSSSASSVSSSTENLKMNGLSKTEPEETSVISSPRLATENGIEKDVQVVSNEKSKDNLSARSSSSKVSEKAHGDGHIPIRTAGLSSEDSSSKVTTSTSSLQKTNSTTSGSEKSASRNPITGSGLEDDGQGARRYVRRGQEEINVVLSPRPAVDENDIQKDVQKDAQVESNEESINNLSAISSSSKEKTQVDGGPSNSAVNDSEDTKSIASSISAIQTTTSAPSALEKSTPRNPITGLGLGDDGQWARRNTKGRDGNPVTGEGYKPAGAEINTTIPSLNGANQVINKNRIPPGGFSSGLW